MACIPNRGYTLAFFFSAEMLISWKAEDGVFVYCLIPMFRYSSVGFVMSNIETNIEQQNFVSDTLNNHHSTVFLCQFTL